MNFQTIDFDAQSDFGKNTCHKTAGLLEPFLLGIPIRK